MLSDDRKHAMSKPVSPPESEPASKAPLPIGQHEGEGSNAVTTHKPDPSAEPDADGEQGYQPRTGYIHGND